MDRIESLAAARITDQFMPPKSLERALARRTALVEHARLEREMADLQVQAGKEKQLNRRVELNLEIKRLETKLCAVHNALMVASL